MFPQSNNIYKFSFVVFMCFDLVLCFSSSTVKFLPGFKGELPFGLETGYIGVDESEDVQLFYYFVKSESNPREDPLILWLTGGPGCSSFSGFALENGPLKFDTDKNIQSFPTLVLNPYSWTQVSNVIFLDLPVGTGFSYGRTLVSSQSYDWQAIDQAYEFLKKWLINHQEFLHNPLYIAGDSYSGLTVPRITQLISNGIYSYIKPHINLKGYLLGNPLTHDHEYNYQIPYAHGMGLISDELYESLQRNCRGEYVDIDPSNILCMQDVDTFAKTLTGINYHQISLPVCEANDIHIQVNKRSYVSNNIIELITPKIYKCPYTQGIGYILSYIWLNDDNVRKALGIREGTRGEWIRCNSNINYTITSKNVIPYHVNLSTKGYRSLIYSGDHDFIVPFLGTQAWIRSLNYSIVDDWHQWLVEGQVAGYTRSYTNMMTFATVKGAGHVALEYLPGQCYVMFKRWLSFQAL